MRPKSATAARGQHRREKELSFREGRPGASHHSQPDHSGYRQVPKPWEWMCLMGLGDGTESSDKALAACVPGLAPQDLLQERGKPRSHAQVPRGVDGPFDQ